MVATVKSRQRIIDHGEVFTPPGLVNDMLDLIAHECERIDSRFLEPACGDGNFLAEVLRRKLLTVDTKNARTREKWERDAILAVCSLYGIDLLPDNIAACRVRLLEIVSAAHTARFKTPLPEEAARAAAYILSKNVAQGDALTFRTTDDRPIVFPEWSPIMARCSNAATSLTIICSTMPTCLICRCSAIWGKTSTFPPPSASFPHAII
jgi:hypothetical protein